MTQGEHDETIHSVYAPVSSSGSLPNGDRPSAPCPDLPPNLKTPLLVAVGLLYLFAVLTTFLFWHQGVLQSQARLRDQPAWQQNFVAIAPWLVIILTILSTASLLTHGWTIEAIARASLGLPIILPSAENLFVKSQIRQ